MISSIPKTEVVLPCKFTIAPGFLGGVPEPTLTAGSTTSPVLPKRREYYAEHISRVGSLDQANRMLDFVQQRDITFIAIDTEFRYSRQGVPMGQARIAHHAHCVEPLLLSFAFAEPSADGGIRLYQFVVDVRQPEHLTVVQDVLRLPTTFVGHYLRAELHCLWKLGLEEPRVVWDTQAAEAALHLGLHHKRYGIPTISTSAHAPDQEDTEAQHESTLSLLGTCARYGVVHPFRSVKERLQKSFLDHPSGEAFTTEQIEYAAADAATAAAIYLPQTHECARKGVLHHLVSVEMPTVVTLSRQTWRGVRFDSAMLQKLAQEVPGKQSQLVSNALQRYGIDNVGSHQQLGVFFRRLGIIDRFQRGGVLTFDKEQLEQCLHVHESVEVIHSIRRIRELDKQAHIVNSLIDHDGRVHPDYKLLGAHSGRITSRWPNVCGLGKVFRPLIVPEQGRGLGEADWAQIEVGIAAAVYRDDALIEMFNVGDVYVEMAKKFYDTELSAEARTLGPVEFKATYGSLREKMKIATLGVIYGLTAHGMALRLGVAKPKAAEFLQRFMALFPALKRAIELTPQYAAISGYVANVSGLRRYRVGTGIPSTWERNWMNNYGVQGSAATVFKAAMNRLDQLYRSHDAWLVIPMHDAVVFEAPLDVLERVARKTEEVMCETVRECFPVLQPRVNINITHPHCWNKDGHADSIERWIADPTFSL